MSIQVADTNDYLPTVKSSAKYAFLRQLPIDGVTGPTLAAAATAESEFEIPAETLNLSRSYLRYSLSFAAGGADTRTELYTYGPLLAIQSISLETLGGTPIAHLNHVGEYSKLCTLAHLKKEELSQNPKTAVGTAVNGGSSRLAETFGEDLGKNVDLTFEKLEEKKAAEPQVEANTLWETLYESNWYVPNAVGNGVFVGAEHGPLTEQPRWLVRSGTNAVVAYTAHIPLNYIFGTLFSLDKDLFFSGETLRLKITWANYQKHGFKHIGHLNQQTFNTTPAEIAAAPTMSNVAAFIAIQKNQQIARGVKALVMSQGLTLTVPYTHVQLPYFAASTQKSVQMKYNAGHGRRLLRIMFAPINGADSVAIKHNFVNVAGAKLTSFYTMVNSERQQHFDLTQADHTDWLQMSDWLEGSAYPSVGVYDVQPVYVDIFHGEKSCEVRKDDFSLGGWDLTNEMLWQAMLTTANAAHRIVVAAVCQRELVLSPEGVRMQ